MTTEKTAVALRILAAINGKQHPEDRDVQLMRAYMPDHRHLPPDELACVAIQQALEAQKAARVIEKASGTGSK